MTRYRTAAVAAALALTLAGTAGCATRRVDRSDAPGYGKVPGTGLEYFCDSAHGNLIYFSDPSGSDVEYEWIVWGGCAPDGKPPAGTVLPDNEG